MGSPWRRSTPDRSTPQAPQMDEEVPTDGNADEHFPFPEFCGWLEKKGMMFWNMRYFVLKDHKLSYYNEIVKTDYDGPSRATVALDGATLSFAAGVLKINPWQLATKHIRAIR